MTAFEFAMLMTVILVGVILCAAFIIVTVGIIVDEFMEKIVKRFFPKYYYYDWEDEA